MNAQKSQTKTYFHVSPCPDVLAEAFCATAAGAISEAQKKKGKAVVFLAGGKTPEKFYSALAGYSKNESVAEWKRVEFFTGDERNVPPDSAESNFRMARAALCRDGSRIGPDQVKGVGTAGRTPAEAAAEYGAMMLASTGGSGVPDLLILGIGPDCHTASIFPGAFRSDDADRHGRRPEIFVSLYVPKLSAVRFTVTPGVIENSPAVILLAAGGEKAEALENAMRPGASFDEFPASVIFSGGGAGKGPKAPRKVHVFTDIDKFQRK